MTDGPLNPGTYVDFEDLTEEELEQVENYEKFHAPVGTLFANMADRFVSSLITGSNDRMDPKWQKDPVGWCQRYLVIKPETIRWSMNPGYEEHTWDGTRDPLATILESLAANKNVGVESGTGTGKTFIGAAVCLWFVSVFPGALVVTTAPKEQQLTLHLWKELQRNWPKFQSIYPDAALTKLLVKMRPPNMDWIVTGFACGVGADEQSATKAQGFHAEHMLIITEETPGIHPAVMTAFENTCTGDHNLRLAFGNPDHEEDALHKICTKPNFVHVRVSALDHPNVVTNTPVVPGAVSRRNVLEREADYGADSPLYKSRVRGICPTEAATALIKRVWCKSAVETAKKQELLAGSEAMGVDVANSERGDKGAIARGKGAILHEVETFPCPNANKLGARVALEMSANKIDEQHVGVDVIGVGAGAVNELLRLTYSVVQLNGASSAIPIDGMTEEFGNLRSQMYWKMRQDLQHARVGLPDDEELFQDLCTPLWFIRNGKIWIESKEDIKKRIQRSPNKGDAAVYWNFVRDGAAAQASTGGRLITL